MSSPGVVCGDGCSSAVHRKEERSDNVIPESLNRPNLTLFNLLTMRFAATGALTGQENINSKPSNHSYPFRGTNQSSEWLYTETSEPFKRGVNFTVLSRVRTSKSS